MESEALGKCPIRHATTEHDNPRKYMEQIKIKEHELNIQKFNECTLQAGKSLLQLQKEEIYKTKNFSNHGEYVESLGIQKSRASQLVSAARNFEKLEKYSVNSEDLPKSEGVIRTLAKLARERAKTSQTPDKPFGQLMSEIWIEAQKSNNDTIRGLQKMLSESSDQDSNRVLVTELEDQPLEFSHTSIDKEPGYQRADNKLGPKECANHINQTLKLFRDFKKTKGEDIADKIEKKLRELKEHFDHIDSIENQETPEITRVK